MSTHTHTHTHTQQAIWHKNGGYDYPESDYKAEFIDRDMFAKRSGYV